jgi:hypothetical protein
LDTSVIEGDWLTQLRVLVRNYHQAFGRPPPAGPDLQWPGQDRPARPVAHRADHRAAARGGFSPSEASDAFFALFTYTAGFQQMGHIAPLHKGTTREETGYYPPLPPEQVPSITAVGPHLDGVHWPGQFDYGLDLLLAGLQAKVAQAGETAAAPQ